MTLDKLINENLAYTSLHRSLNEPPSKRLKTNETLVPILFGLLNIRLGKAKFKKIKILLDSGASCTIIDTALVSKL